jgi:hypothetical protein
MYGQFTERHVASFGLEYDGRRRALTAAPPLHSTAIALRPACSGALVWLPSALLPLRDRIAESAGVEAGHLRAVLVIG